MGTHKYIRWFSEVNRNDIPLVGGKGANLGELTQNGVAVPPGFCVIAGAYRDFIRISGLNASIENIIRNIDFENTDDLSDKCGEIRKLIMEAPFPKEIEKEVKIVEGISSPSSAKEDNVKTYNAENKKKEKRSKIFKFI